jgi:hypothetical protein
MVATWLKVENLKNVGLSNWVEDTVERLGAANQKILSFWEYELRPKTDRMINNSSFFIRKYSKRIIEQK